MSKMKTAEKSKNKIVLYRLWNETDSVFASPNSFKTKQAAETFARGFRQRFEAQGYYFTVNQERIPVESLKLVVVEKSATRLS